MGYKRKTNRPYTKRCHHEWLYLGKFGDYTWWCTQCGTLKFMNERPEGTWVTRYRKTIPRSRRERNELPNRITVTKTLKRTKTSDSSTGVPANEPASCSGDTHD